MTRHAWLLVPLLLAGLAGCNDDDDVAAVRRGAAAEGNASDLPAPEGAVGSVTGMPDDPGPGTVALDPAAPAASVAPPAGATVPAGDDGGLDAMAVETDFPEVRDGRSDAADASARVAPTIIVPDAAPPTGPRAPPAPAVAPAADATASTTFVTDVPSESAPSEAGNDAPPAGPDD